ncbi:MAG: class I SAM-dependent methyltransferase [Sphingobacteriales bacterium]|nr:class I SAM-dependent methyltransferase [Sphingobacteriales bacterium]
MINNNCPICQTSPKSNSSLFKIKKESIDYRIIKCENCGHIYTFFDKEIAIQVYYDEKDYQVKDTKKSIFYQIQEYEYRQVLQKIKHLKPNKGLTLLDFGSGKGLFLNFARQFGFEVKGVETSLPRAHYAQEVFGLDINTDIYEKGKIFNQRFDIITLFHVLEHLPSPETLLHHLTFDNLNNTGLLVLEVPNVNSWQSKWAGKHWLHLDIPRHLNHFSKKQLHNILLKNDFQILKMESFSWHLGVIGMMQSIWNWFGYRGFLIGDLKQKKSLALLLKIVITLPFAMILEILAAFFNHGGVIRLYAQKKSI